MKHDAFYAVMLSLLFIFLFIAAEVLHRKFLIREIYTRTLVRFFSAVLILLLPLLFTSIFSVLSICLILGVLLYIFIKAQLPATVGSLDKPSISILFPSAVFVCYVCYYLNNNIICFYLPLLTLLICGPLASFISDRWPYGRFIIRYHRKTLSGTAAFFIAALVLAASVLFWFTDLPAELVIRKSLLMGSLAAAAEVFGIRGMHHLAIPASILLVLRLQL
jgi:phytol kinase